MPFNTVGAQVEDEQKCKQAIIALRKQCAEYDHLDIGQSGPARDLLSQAMGHLVSRYSHSLQTGSCLSGPGHHLTLCSPPDKHIYTSQPAVFL